MFKPYSILKGFTFLFIVWVPIYFQLVFGAQVNLYQAVVPVNSQNDNERISAIQQGMKQVLIKLTGNEAIANQAAIKSSIDNAANYVREYAYLPDVLNKDQFQLQVQYNKADINSLLASANMAYWSDNRPLILVWLTSVNERGATNIISNDSASNLQNQIKQRGSAIGIPFVFPVMDMNDASMIAVEDVKTVNLSLLKEVGKRYEPDAYLAASIEKKLDTLTSHWHFILNDKRWDWTTSEKSIDKLLDSALDHLEQILLKLYAAHDQKNKTQWVKLDVSDITSTQDLHKLTAYLKQISLVKQVQLDQVVGDKVQLSVMLNGSLDTFTQNAVIGNHLVLAESSSTNLTFHWVQ